MASIIFNSGLDDAVRGLIDFENDDFACLLVTAAYSPNKDTHTRRSDITNEVVGAGYVAGGTSAVVSVTKDTANDRINISLGAVSWNPATITARGAVYYKSRGGLASADELVAYIEQAGDVASIAGNWSLGASTLRIQN